MLSATCTHVFNFQHLLPSCLYAFHSHCTFLTNSVAFSSSAFVNVVDCGTRPCLLSTRGHSRASHNYLQMDMFFHWLCNCITLASPFQPKLCTCNTPSLKKYDQAFRKCTRVLFKGFFGDWLASRNGKINVCVSPFHAQL